MASDKKYQWLLIALLSANFGVVFFDRQAFTFLGTFIQPDLNLTQAQIGDIAAAFSFAWAIAGLFMGTISDRFGRRKTILVIATLVFSCASVLSGFATGFVALMAARMLMGIAEGGIMPITQTLIAADVAPERRGLAHGIAQNVGANFLANFLGPIVVVAIALAVGWRNAFMIVAIPGFVMALLLAWFVREPHHLDKHPKPTLAGALALLSDRNILVCCLLSILLVAYLVVFAVFMPFYLEGARGIPPGEMALDHGQQRPRFHCHRIHRARAFRPHWSQASGRRGFPARRLRAAWRHVGGWQLHVALLPGICRGRVHHRRVPAGHGHDSFRGREAGSHSHRTQPYHGDQ